MVDIRLAKVEDLALLGDIELNADKAFEKYGYAKIFCQIFEETIFGFWRHRRWIFCSIRNIIHS